MNASFDMLIRVCSRIVCRIGARNIKSRKSMQHHHANEGLELTIVSAQVGTFCDDTFIGYHSSGNAEHRVGCLQLGASLTLLPTDMDFH